MEDITDADYTHTKRVCRDFKLDNLGEYHDFYIHSGTLLLVDIFTNFQNTSVCSYHVTYAFQSEFTLYSCLNVKELLARNRREI